MSTPTRKAVGERGSWFATVDGERLPCVHQHWIRGAHHRAVRVSRNNPKDAELVEAIERHRRVIVTKDKVTGDGEAFERQGYIAVFAVENIRWEDDILEFDLVERQAHLRN